MHDPFKLARFSGQLQSILRIVTGLLFLSHGTSKLLGFPATAPSPPIASLLGVAGIMELVGGTLIVLGLFTRPVALLLAGEMAVAYWMVHSPRSLFPIQNMGEPAVLFCFIFLYLSACGPGPWAIERTRD